MVGSSITSCGSRVLPAMGNFASTSAIRSARRSQIVGADACPRAISLTSNGMYACCMTLPQPMMPTETVSAMTLLPLRGIWVNLLAQRTVGRPVMPDLTT